MMLEDEISTDIGREGVLPVENHKDECQGGVKNETVTFSFLRRTEEEHSNLALDTLCFWSCPPLRAGAGYIRQPLRDAG